MGEFILPPIANQGELEEAIQAYPKWLHEDCVQESWVAHLEGKDPVEVIREFANHEKYRRRREISETDLTQKDFIPRETVPASRQSKSTARKRAATRRLGRDRISPEAHAPAA